MSTVDPLLGTTIVGRYRIEERLGAGGMGAVYRATQLPLGRAVALKVIKRSLTDDAVAVARFEKEARAMATLHDPAIVTIHDFGTLDGSELGATSGAGLFIAMELLDGEDLGHRLARETRLDWRLAAHIGARVCDALVVAHRARVVHRDLKPANIMLSGDPKSPRVKVVDFGVAKLGHDAGAGLTNTGMVVGTPGYIAPEQLSGITDDPRSDLYALGVILFEALAGRPLFDAETPVKILLMHMTERPPPLSSVMGTVSNAPAALHALVDQLLSKDPELRPATAADVGAQLTGLVDTPSSQVDSPSSFASLDAGTPTEGTGTPTPVASTIESKSAETPSEFYRTPPSQAVPSMSGATSAEAVSARALAHSPAVLASTTTAPVDTPPTGAHFAHREHPLVGPRSHTLRNTFFVIAGALALSVASCAVGVIVKLRKSDVVADGEGLAITFDNGRKLIFGNDGIQLFESDGSMIADLNKPTPPPTPTPPTSTAPLTLPTPSTRGATHARREPPERPTPKAAFLDGDRARLDAEAQERGLIDVVIRTPIGDDQNALMIFAASMEPHLGALGQKRAQEILAQFRDDTALRLREGHITHDEAAKLQQRIVKALEVVQNLDK
jgi:serine/threonine protein kinase